MSLARRLAEDEPPMEDDTPQLQRDGDRQEGEPKQCRLEAQRAAGAIDLEQRGIGAFRTYAKRFFPFRTRGGAVAPFEGSEAGERQRIRKSSAHANQAQYVVRVLVEIPGADLSAEQIGPEPMLALDIAADKIERRLRKRKTERLARRDRDSARAREKA